MERRAFTLSTSPDAKKGMAWQIRLLAHYEINGRVEDPLAIALSRMEVVRAGAESGKSEMEIYDALAEQGFVQPNFKNMTEFVALMESYKHLAPMWNRLLDRRKQKAANR